MVDELLALRLTTPNLSFPEDRSSPELLCTKVEKCFDVDIRERDNEDTTDPLLLFCVELPLVDELEEVVFVCVVLLVLARKRDCERLEK